MSATIIERGGRQAGRHRKYCLVVVYVVVPARQYELVKAEKTPIS
jgi:hypothetical protein